MAAMKGKHFKTILDTIGGIFFLSRMYLVSLLLDVVGEPVNLSAASDFFPATAFLSGASKYDIPSVTVDLEYLRLRIFAG